MKRTFFSPRSYMKAGSLAVALIASIGVRGQNQIVNPPSKFEITVDGQFTGGVVNGQVQGEWSDVTPAGFISPASPTGPLVSVPLNDPNLNSLLYAGIAPGVAAEAPELYLMYDYLPRTGQQFAPGELVAEIAFPLTTQDSETHQETIHPNSRVVIEGEQQATLAVQANVPQSSSFFDVFVDLDNNGNLQNADLFGIEGAVGFGPSTLQFPTPHLLVELGVPLLIPEGFANPEGPLPPAGQDGVYSPAPAFWGASIANDANDPPASSAIFNIDPLGNTLIIPVPPTTVPDSLSAWCTTFAFGLVLLLGRRWHVLRIRETIG